MIINQSRAFIYGEIYYIDWYDDGTFGWADVCFADTIQELVAKLRKREEY